MAIGPDALGVLFLFLMRDSKYLDWCRYQNLRENEPGGRPHCYRYTSSINGWHFHVCTWSFPSRLSGFDSIQSADVYLRINFLVVDSSVQSRSLLLSK
jgi:hypothetical protein